MRLCKIFKRKKVFKKFQFYIPHTHDFDKVVEMFKFNRIRVDDLCSTTTSGRVVDLWIHEDDLDDWTLDMKPGSFL